MKPLFTIGIASYNYASYMEKGLNAIKRQKFKNYEVLISDDCSTDNSVEVIKKYIADNPDMNIRLIENDKNRGIEYNKNKLIECCEGEYLMLCDADDWMADNCLEVMADIIEKEHPDRIISEVAHISDDGKIIQIECLTDSQTKWGWNIHHGCANRVEILRKHNIKIHGRPDDVYFTIEFSKYCKKVSIIKEVMYYWLVHLDSEGRGKIPVASTEWVKSFHGTLLHDIENVIHYIEKRNDENAKKDVEELRLVMLKMYYFKILFSFQKYNLRNKLKYYKVLKNIMYNLDNNYLSNVYLKKGSTAPLREYAMKSIRLCAGLERYHLMPMALIGYHIIGKFKYFDQ